VVVIYDGETLEGCSDVVRYSQIVVVFIVIKANAGEAVVIGQELLLF
jgi:hypothetical protein